MTFVIGVVALVTAACVGALGDTRTAACPTPVHAVVVRGAPVTICGHVRQVVFPDREHGWLLTADDCWLGGDVFVYRSGDGGRTWRLTPDTFLEVNCTAGTVVHLTARDASDATVVRTWGNSWGGDAVRTFDGGLHWHAVPSIPGRGDLVFVTRLHGWFAIGYESYWPLYETRDGGTHWHVRPLPRPSAFRALTPCLRGAPRFRGDHGVFAAFVRSKRRFAAALYRTSDAGRTWTVGVVGLAHPYGHRPGIDGGPFFCPRPLDIG